MATFLNQTSDKPDGYIGLYTAKIGDKRYHYVYLAHLSEPYGFSTDYPKPFDWNDFHFNLPAFGIWDSVNELKDNFEKYVEAKGFDAKLTAIMPIHINRTVNFCISGELINPLD